MYWKKTLASVLCFTSFSLLYAANNSQTLQNEIIAANTGGVGTGAINFTANIDLTVPFFTPPYVPAQPNLLPINVQNNFTPTAFPITINGGIATEVADCIRTANIVPRSDFATVIQLMGLLSDREVNRVLIDLSPVNYGALDWINARNNNYIADILSQHLFELCCSPRDCNVCGCNASFWVDVFGNLMENQKYYDNLGRFRANALGVVSGLDYCFCDCFTLGGAFVYTHTWLELKRHRGHGNINSYYGALYSSYHCCCLNIDLSVIGGASDHSLVRRILIQDIGVISSIIPQGSGADGIVVDTLIPIDINRVAKSHPWGYFATGHLGISTDWNWCCTTFEPFALVDYNYFHREQIRERGADSLNLDVRKHYQHMLRGEGGLRIYRTWSCECDCFAPYLGVSWVGEFPIGHSKQRANFVGQDYVIDVNSFHSSVQLVSPEAGIKFTRNSGFSLLLGYKGLYNSKTSINELEGRFEWVF